MSPEQVTEAPAKISISSRDDSTVVIRFAGDWHLRDGMPEPPSLVWRTVEELEPREIGFDTSELGYWDSSLVTMLARGLRVAGERGIRVDRSGLPSGLRQLLSLAEAVPEKKDARRDVSGLPVLDRIGESALRSGQEAGALLDFLGDVVAAFAAFFRGRARIRKADIRLLIQQAGADALGIVSLVSFLLGLILAFVAAIQLRAFGAQIYVADLVGVAMVRDMAALMTGIIMAGRSGAAYAAQIGTMKVTQELDALTTTGISPIEFLVLPRIIALTIMMPLLTLYADLVGILGGASVGSAMLDLNLRLYFTQTFGAVGLAELIGGLFKGSVYGALVAIAGCLRGMQSGKSASAVGDAATSAVVTGIIAIIGSCGLFAWLFYVLGI